MRLLVVENVHHSFTVFLGEDALEAGETVLECRFVGRAVESDPFIVDAAAYEITLTAREQVLQAVVVPGDFLFCLLTLLRQLEPLPIEVTLTGEVEGGDEIVDEVALSIDEGLYAHLNIFVESELGIIEMQTVGGGIFRRG